MQNHLRVAGQAPAEVIGGADGFIEGADLQTVRAAEDAGKGLDGGAEEIVVRIADGLVPQGGADVERGLLRDLAAVQAGHQARPEHAEGAELGDFHEELAADRDGEPGLGGDDVNIQPALVHFAEIFEGGGQGEGEFLHGIGAGIVPGPAVDADGLKLRRVDGGPFGERGHFAVGAGQRLRQFALVGEHAERIHFHAAAQGGHGFLPPPAQAGKEGREGQGGGAGADVQKGFAQFDARQGAFQIRQAGDGETAHTHFRRAGRVRIVAVAGSLIHDDVQRIQPAADGVERRLIEILRRGGGDFLGHGPRFPRVPAGAGAAHVRRKAGPRIHVGEAGGVLRPINGVQGDALRRGGEHLLVERRAFQLGFNQLAPVFVGRDGKLREQTFWNGMGRGGTHRFAF